VTRNLDNQVAAHCPAIFLGCVWGELRLMENIFAVVCEMNVRDGTAALRWPFP
jgi:hypothetical protein